MFKTIQSSCLWGEKSLILESGRIARQADGAVMVKFGDTMVLCTAVLADSNETAFLPFSVTYQEKFYAIGKIPGGFTKKEQKFSEREILTSRLIDRIFRPLLKLQQELQITCTVMSYDDNYPSDIAAIIGTMTVIKLAGIDINEIISGVKVALYNNELVINPSTTILAQSSINLIIGGSNTMISMIECEATQIKTDDLVDIINKTKEHLIVPIDLINTFIKQFKKIKKKNTTLNIEDQLTTSKHYVRIKKIALSKNAKSNTMDKLINDLKKEFIDIPEQILVQQLKLLIKKEVKNYIITTNQRTDKRAFDEIREINCEMGILPKTHGSGLFTRGSTQVLSVLTLGGKNDMRMNDDVTGLKNEKLMIDYVFNSYAVNEINFSSKGSRREIGHAKLIYKAINAIIPPNLIHTLRFVCEVTESNGSSSMASICAIILALQNAEINLINNIAGIAMGLIVKDDNDVIILSDITEEEDHLGDMDFKVAGSRQGITALQLDVKIDNISYDILAKALQQAHVGIQHILDKMDEVQMNCNADKPKIASLKIDESSVKDLIGNNGKNIKDICETTHAKIDINNGKVNILADSDKKLQQTIDEINKIILPPKVGDLHDINVSKILDYGLMVKTPGGIEGFVHVSDISNDYIDNIHSHIAINQRFKAKIMSIDKNNKIKFKIKGVDFSSISHETIKKKKRFF